MQNDLADCLAIAPIGINIISLEPPAFFFGVISWLASYACRCFSMHVLSTVECYTFAADRFFLASTEILSTVEAFRPPWFWRSLCLRWIVVSEHIQTHTSLIPVKCLYQCVWHGFTWYRPDRYPFWFFPPKLLKRGILTVPRKMSRLQKAWPWWWSFYRLPSWAFSSCLLFHRRKEALRWVCRGGVFVVAWFCRAQNRDKNGAVSMAFLSNNGHSRQTKSSVMLHMIMLLW